MRPALARALVSLTLCLISPLSLLAQWDERVVFISNPSTRGGTTGGLIDIEGYLFVATCGHDAHKLRGEVSLTFWNGSSATGIFVAKNLDRSSGGADSALIRVKEATSNGLRVFKLSDSAPRLPQEANFRGFLMSRQYRHQRGILRSGVYEGLYDSPNVRFISGESGGPVTDNTDEYLIGIISASDGDTSIVTPWHEIKALVDQVRANILATTGPAKHSVARTPYCQSQQQASPVSQVLFFASPTCGPCQEMKPEVEALNQQGLIFRYVDVNQERSLASKFGITRVPAFVPIDAQGNRIPIGQGRWLGHIGKATREGLRRLFHGSAGGYPGHAPTVTPTPANPPSPTTSLPEKNTEDDSLHSLLKEHTEALNEVSSAYNSVSEILKTAQREQSSFRAELALLGQRIENLPEPTCDCDCLNSITVINERLNELANQQQEQYAKLREEITNIRQPEPSGNSAPARLEGVIQRVPKSNER